MKKIVVILLFIIPSLFAGAQQIREFTADTIKYIEEIQRFTNNYISSNETQIVETFISLWQNGAFTWKETISSHVKAPFCHKLIKVSTI